ncbi:DNA modification methylase [Candidatus Nitrososphaera evergladensis SR1]|uniref:Type II methyltransferase n=1 Tax=Candidatus Nitrososphaera evergladensis SR1 TaxID=1459636 RepID=A0A075MN27_9ARCH|nr:site-specific DNA-methyltransferase [Candidatus Nitrososphaera evergladensis]AIF82911.1 DNA modification methylase [Candidatus Nitrososphaera evergladensis SR1]
MAGDDPFQVLQGDARDIAKSLEPGTFRAIITSPPYFGHRHYGPDRGEIGQERDVERYLDALEGIFVACKRLLAEDGSLWIVIGDTRRRKEKLRVPHRLAERLSSAGYRFREDIIWYKKNNISSSSRDNFSQAYEYVLFFSKNAHSYADLDAVRVQGNEAVEGRNRVPPKEMLQFAPENPDRKEIERIADIIHNATAGTPISELPSTSEIARAYGYDPEKFCPTCYRKFKRHATRRRIGDHKHYPIFAVCNPNGKNPSNVWEIATRAHYGNEHFAIFPEELVEKIILFATKKGDFVLDPFCGRGTTGISAVSLGRRFVGIDLYRENVDRASKNILRAQQQI